MRIGYKNVILTFFASCNTIKKKRGRWMMEDMSLSELIANVQQGDEVSFNELYRRYHRLVYYIAYEVCQNDADAKDVLQDTFLQVQKSIQNLKEPEYFKAWLNQIVFSKAKNLFRKNKTRNLDDESPYYQHHLVEQRSYMNPKENLHVKTDEELLHYFISFLPASQKEVLLLCYFQNFTMQEMADVLDIPIGTVKTRLMYSKNALRKMILAYEEENQIKLDFSVADVTIAAAFAYAYHAFIKAPVFYAPITKKSVSQTKKPISSTVAGKMAIASTLVIASGSGVYMIAKQQNQIELPHNVITTQDEKNTHAKEYYFKLLLWANNKNDIESKSKEEMERILPLYEHLKKSNTRYYERLQKDGWVSVFEEKMKNL